MRNHIRLIYVAALLTGLVITIFQLLWARNAIKINLSNFNGTAANLLQKTIDDNIAAQRDSGHIPFIREIKEIMESGDIAKSLLHLKGKQRKNSKPDFTPEEDRLISRSIFPEADMEQLTAEYRKVLAARHIPLHVTLLKDTSHPAVIPVQVAAIFHTGCNEQLITAHFQGMTMHMIRENTWTISVSTFLILLTWCSLWYMLYIIRRQVKLDHMKNDFINNMTHELRTPLTILRSTHEAIDKFGYINDRDRTLRYLQANRQVIDLMDKNIDRILQIAQYENSAAIVQTEKTNLKTLLENTIQHFTPGDNTIIKLHYHLPQEEVTTDAHIIETIINNLIDNALKYAHHPIEINISVQQAGNNILLEVKDNGIGIDKAHLPYIFDKFYRVPTGNVHDVKGYGIGLSYVKTLTAMLNGTISVQSRPGEGTTFSIQFPQA